MVGLMVSAICAPAATVSDHGVEEAFAEVSCWWEKEVDRLR